MDDDIRRLIFQAIDQTISEDDFKRLEEAIERNEEVRSAYVRAVGLCESLSEIAVDSPGDDPAPPIPRPVSPDAGGFVRRSAWQFSASQLAAAAVAMILVGGTAFWLGQRDPAADATRVATAEQPESRIAGHATLRRAVGLVWPENAVRRREGDVLPNGPFAFDEGVAEIDFFCGATLIVEGPARLEIESDWSVRLDAGRLRANVPPAARGFVVTAAGSEIVDLGTEFALEVGSEHARVEVIDGEVELRGGEHDGKHLVTGEGESLKGSPAGTGLVDRVSTGADLSELRQQADDRLFVQWKTHSRQLRRDERLIAYYPIADGVTGRLVSNTAPSGSGLNGLLVGPAERTSGRFGPESTGLEFDRPGSRVRTRIDGEFAAFTFACWVRIDGLEHRYNALFMADGYENGEPHWQIRDDGSLMFSVMVDDTREIRHFSEIDQQTVAQAGLHRVYYSQPFWDISKSGQWFHLAAVYDPTGRSVDQYVNGDLVSSEEIIDKFHVGTLRIGPSEIGNWGQPFRKTPWFAVRNLNGTIDELAIFGVALGADELRSLYEQGKPVGY